MEEYKYVSTANSNLETYSNSQLHLVNPAGNFVVFSSLEILFVIERSTQLIFPGILKCVISLPKFLNCKLVKNP